MRSAQDISDPDTWPIRLSVKRQLLRSAEDAEWAGDFDRADSLRRLASNYTEDRDHEVVPPF